MTYDDALHPAVEESETVKLESTGQNIGERLVETLKCTEGKGQIFWDTALKGFGVRVMASGVKSFILNYRVHKRERRYTIGRYPDWSCEAARNEAARLCRQIDTGLDPMAARRKPLRRKNESATLLAPGGSSSNYLSVPQNSEYGSKSAMGVLEGYVTKPELAQQLRKSTRTLDRLERQRVGPPRTKIGRSILYRIESVREWLQAQERRRRLKKP